MILCALLRTRYRTSDYKRNGRTCTEWGAENTVLHLQHLQHQRYVNICVYAPLGYTIKQLKSTATANIIIIIAVATTTTTKTTTTTTTTTTTSSSSSSSLPFTSTTDTNMNYLL